MSARLSESDWQLRAEIYARFVERGRPPSAADMAKECGRTLATTRAAYRRLHQAHQILLDEHGEILMANPLAARETDYAVWISEASARGERLLWANCAWDALGVSALLKQDARIVARNPITREELRLAVLAGDLRTPAFFVHFALPVHRWYEDLIHT